MPSFFTTLSTLLRTNRFFFLPYVVLLLFVAILQLIYSQELLMQWVNIRSNPTADVFFTYATYIGDGATFAVVCVILLIYHRRVGLIALASFALSTLTSEFLKRVVFTGSPRPLKFFEHSTYQYHIIKGLHIYSYNSFPSGHTTTAFAMCGLLALLNRRKVLGGFFLILAVLAGYSRVYLFQHFVEDAFVGSLIGTLSSVIVYQLLWQWAVAKTPFEA